MRSIFNARFVSIDARSRRLLSLVEPTDLYRRPRPIMNSMSPFSVGEYILRSAAMVEQTFGGLTTRLWDDPFEWTLPEKLDNKTKVLDYLDEVEATRRNGFAFFTSDADLLREVPAPEHLRSIAEILVETIGKAEHYQGRAFSIFQILSDTTLPSL